MRTERIKLKGVNNMRDLGGLPAADGKRIKSGRLIRSGRLYKLPAKTVAALENMGVDTVVDMRLDKEIETRRPTLIKTAEYYYLPLVCTATPGITTGKSMAGTMRKESRRIEEEFGNADNYMISMYKYILFEEESQKKLKTIFDLILKEENCIIWHCNSGKDRAGLVSMLVEGALGVSREDIVDDYMATRKIQLRQRRLQRLGLALIPGFGDFKKLLRALMATKPEYINGAIDETERRYGSITGYVINALGVSAEDIERLKDKYLE